MSFPQIQLLKKKESHQFSTFPLSIQVELSAPKLLKNQALLKLCECQMLTQWGGKVSPEVDQD